MFSAVPHITNEKTESQRDCVCIGGWGGAGVSGWKRGMEEQYVMETHEEFSAMLSDISSRSVTAI